jgi:hypothetical protein
MVLENVKEMWTETPKLSNGKKGRPVNKDRFISKMLVNHFRGQPFRRSKANKVHAGFCEETPSSWFC